MFCGTCNYTTDRKFNYQAHLKSSKHLKRMKGESTVKLYECEMDGCQYKTYDWTNYDRHTKAHQGRRRSAYECLACDMTLKDQEKLNQHVKTGTHHDNVVSKFPETTIRKMDGLLPTRLDCRLRDRYIKKLTGSPAESSGRKSKPCPNNRRKIKSVALKMEDYPPPNTLDDEERRRLIDRTVLWYNQNGMDIRTEGYDETEDVAVNYQRIYEAIFDNPTADDRRQGEWVIPPKTDDGRIILRVKDYWESGRLLHEQRRLLIENLLAWLIQQGLTPEEQFNMEEINKVDMEDVERVEVIYSGTIYQFMTDELEEDFRKAGYVVDNIEY